MGRTATAFLVLMAIGGCVADDAGPVGVLPVGKTGQPANAPSYATWNRSDQFAALQDDMAARPVSAPSAPTPIGQGAMMIAQKPSMPQKLVPATAPMDVVVPLPAVQAQAPAPQPTPGPTPAAVVVQGPPIPTPAPVAPPSPIPAPPTLIPPVPAAPSAVQSPPLVVDSQLVAATMVQAPSDPPAPEPVPVKVQPAVVTTTPAAAEAEQPSPSTGSASIRVVNSKRVTLNYELKDVGSSGVSGVELWCTQDGHSWKKGEVFSQTNKSFSTEVKDEGLYGFTILARNGAGLGKNAPASGDPPQVWVMVDVTKPVVQITGVEIGHNGKVPTVQIRWSAKDKNLGPRPITLSYAEQPEGPWSVIVAGVENSGQYEWQAPANAPRRLLVRVEAADMPGNVGSTQTANPLRLDAAVTIAPPPPTVDTSRPSAAISGVEPGN